VTPDLKTRPTPTTPGLKIDAGRSFSTGVTAVCAIACLAGAVALHANDDRWSPPASVDAPALLYVRSPQVARRLALEYKGVGADVYWIRALQHFGEERLSPPSHVRDYSLLYPLLDLTTTLDPSFSIAYRFGAIFLGEPYPGGPGRPDLAIALLDKGLASQPNRWQYMQDLGFVYYWHLRDYPKAADCFRRAADIPGAPSWLKPLAAVTLAEGGNRTASRALWQQLAQADEDWLRDAARLRLTQLDAMDVMDQWRRARAAGGHPGLPVDPSGTPFEIDPATGDITVSRSSKLFPLPGQLQGAP
jgi:hypothetical protein